MNESQVGSGSETLPGLSVVLITRNEAARIARCLRSVAFADEIVVLDNASDDETVARAVELGARVVVDAHWPGFGAQKNRVLAMARHDWVLSIDADEEIDARLAAAIRSVVAGESAAAPGANSHPPQPTAFANGYWIDRRSCFAGRPLRFGDWHGDRVLRLVRNGRARFSDLPVHERLECEPPTARLPGLMMHYTIDSMQDARVKALRYARAGAPALAARGRGGPISAAMHAVWTFVRGSVFRGGLLDGAYGLRLAWANAYGTWLRYRIAGRLRAGKDAGMA